MKRLELPADDPFPRNALKLEGGEHLYRLRVGDYRVVYGVEQKTKLVIVHYIRHRRDVYREL